MRTSLRIKQKHLISIVKGEKKEEYRAISGVAWNPNSKNLIGGHKRVMAHDIYYAYDGTKNDYDIKVEAIELDEKTEKEQNIFLNKKQGKFDRVRLFDLLQEIEPINAGFSQDEIRTLEAMVPSVGMVSEAVNVSSDMNTTVDLDAINKVKDAKKKQANRAFLQQVEMNNSLIVKFDTAEEKAYFCESIGIDFNLTTIDGNVLVSKMDE